MVLETIILLRILTWNMINSSLGGIIASPRCLSRYLVSTEHGYRRRLWYSNSYSPPSNKIILFPTPILIFQSISLNQRESVHPASQLPHSRYPTFLSIFLLILLSTYISISQLYLSSSSRQRYQRQELWHWWECQALRSYYWGRGLGRVL